MTKIAYLLLLTISLGWPALCLAQDSKVLNLKNDKLDIRWQQGADGGWKVDHVKLNYGKTWHEVGVPSGEYTLLYSATRPDTVPTENIKSNTGADFPGVEYHYQKDIWRESTSPVALNTAGKAYHFFPGKLQSSTPGQLLFSHETEVARVEATWFFDPLFPGDVIVKQTLIPKQDGWFSLATPCLLTVEEQDLSWATVPGYFQGSTIENDFVRSYAYGQGVPSRPVIYRERSASTLAPIVSTKNRVTLSVIPAPGSARDPWASDRNTQKDWLVGLSHKNRKSQLSPTLYMPVLGEPASMLKVNDRVSFEFRYSLVNGDWYQAIKHAINDIYQFDESLALRKNRQSLSRRIERLRAYLTDSRTSMWRTEDFKGMKIGGQAYLGGVVGSQKDAMKNADYGAMWMLAQTSSDQWLRDSVLPFAQSFKLAQQQTDTGFFQGSATGQYFLSLKKKFVEEWGEFVEPVSLTYYTMLDVGNILLFEPGNALLKERLRLGAERLLKWQKSDGSWEVAYDQTTRKPLFNDLEDLRPTFYGMIVAYRILGDQKYLLAAKKGAEWFIKNGVEKGRFIGVCGDARYAPDFATGQTAQALLDLFEITKDTRYRDAGISAARMYTSSVYTHPIATEKTKNVNGTPRKDCEISQSGLSFEHGGILGSANRNGPIQLCSHAGMFVRFFALTKDSLFLQMARAAAIGRDAFVDSTTSVASYYWNVFNRGAGPYPHHAWWQVGWITDYLMAEASLRSAGQVSFPRGFVTPKVGPHQTYGFAPGKIFGAPASLLNTSSFIRIESPQVEYITAISTDKKRV
ncbi:MAG TPA: glycerophosphoryl diester phosphodiesterase, partial [Chitinophagaceae bacterium]|nr:glycerophosphoryl diester phosphodiesterase [Chitinophagaceae bacterium]